MNKKTLVIVLILAVITAIPAFIFVTVKNTAVVAIKGAPSLIQAVNSGSTGYSQESGAKMMIERPTTSIMPPYITPDAALDVVNRVYEKYSSFSVVVDSVEKYTSNLTSYFLSIGGRILSSNLNTSDKTIVASLTVKVPVEKFDEANMRVKTDIKKTYYENINSLDETGALKQASDELTRLNEEKTKKELELLAARTDIEKKQIEYEIQRLESKISSATSQVNTVETKTSYATLSLVVANSEKYFNPSQTPQRPDLLETLKEAGNKILDVLYFVAVAFIWVAAFALMWLPIVLIVKVLFFRGTKKVAKKD
ncbi:MAG: DUF4349 domain-containing protein [Patescibacteria group bacterium]